MRREGRREIAASDSPSSPASASASAPCSSLLRSVPLLLLSPHVLIESANLVKTIHYFTIMMAAAPTAPSPPPSPRGEQLTISAQTNDLTASRR